MSDIRLVIGLYLYPSRLKVAEKAWSEVKNKTTVKKPLMPEAFAGLCVEVISFGSPFSLIYLI